MSMLRQTLGGGALRCPPRDQDGIDEEFVAVTLKPSVTALPSAALASTDTRMFVNVAPVR